MFCADNDMAENTTDYSVGETGIYADDCNK